MEQETKRAPGRPATGVTTKRNVRIGATWDRAEELALALARQNGTVRRVPNRVTGQVEEKGDVTAYVEEALRRENARVARQLGRILSDGERIGEAVRRAADAITGGRSAPTD